MWLDSSFVWVKGVNALEVPDHIHEHWYSGRMGVERNRTLQGAFAAHSKAWREIVDSDADHGVIVLEDDCVQFREYPRDAQSYPSDAITLLGGCFKGFGRWSCRMTGFVTSCTFLRVLCRYQAGVNPLPKRTDSSRQASQELAAKSCDNMCWAMCVAYFVPAGMAAKLCKDVEACKKRVLKSPDVWLSAYTKYFLWPPAFGDQGGESECLTHPSERGTDLYCSSEMRASAERASRPLPERGCAREQILAWQIKELQSQLDCKPCKRQG